MLLWHSVCASIPIMKLVLSFGTIALSIALMAGCGGSGGGSSSGGSGGGGGGGSAASGRIAFEDTETGRSRIWVNDVSTGGLQLQAASTTANNRMPAISPDTSKIAFVSDRDGSSELYVMTINQPATLQRLTTDTTVDENPAWISSTRLVWSKGVAGADQELVAMNIDGTGFAQLTDNALDDKFPAVSRDGSTIAFIRMNGGTNRSIYRMPAGGGTATLVNSHSTNRPSVSWQDSGNLLFTALDGGVESCMRINASGGSATKVTEGWGPKPSPAGGRIIFARIYDGKPQLYTSTTGGGDVRRYSLSAEGILNWDWRG